MITSWVIENDQDNIQIYDIFAFEFSAYLHRCEILSMLLPIIYQQYKDKIYK